MLPVSRNPGDNILFGYGRGGFGAVKYALSRPDRFGSAFSVSFDDRFVVKHMEEAEENSKFESGYPSPEETAVSSENILWLAEQYDSERWPKPVVHMACGTDEAVYKRNVLVRDHLCSAGFKVEWEEFNSPGGWRFCSERLEQALNRADSKENEGELV